MVQDQHHPKGRSAITAALKAHAKNWLAPEAASLGETIDKETDRGGVILLSSLVEDALAARIKDNFVQLSSDEDARLFGPDAPIGTFSAKIKTAYALGIIDRQHTKMCELLREMRNACAHSRRDISFESDALLEALDLLTSDIFKDRPSDLYFPGIRKLTFLYCVSYLIKIIKGDPKDVAVSFLQNQLDEANHRVREALAQQASPERQ